MEHVARIRVILLNFQKILTLSHTLEGVHQLTFTHLKKIPNSGDVGNQLLSFPEIMHLIWACNCIFKTHLVAMTIVSGRSFDLFLCCAVWFSLGTHGGTELLPLQLHQARGLQAFVVVHCTCAKVILACYNTTRVMSNRWSNLRIVSSRLEALFQISRLIKNFKL